MLAQIEPLPGPQQKLAILHRYPDRGLGQRRLDMRRHVIRPFRRVPEPVHRRMIRIRHQPRKELIEIPLHIRIGIFLDRQRAGRVPHIGREEAGA